METSSAAWRYVSFLIERLDVGVQTGPGSICDPLWEWAMEGGTPCRGAEERGLGSLHDKQLLMEKSLTSRERTAPPQPTGSGP